MLHLRGLASAAARGARAASTTPLAAAACAVCGGRAQPTPCPSLPCLQQISAAPDHFALFGLPRQFDLPLPALEHTFKRLQRVVHPDFFTGASEALREASAGASSRLNVAYRALRSPSARAQYLLGLLSGGSGEEALGEGSAGSSSSSSSRYVSPALLAEVMEAREVVEDAATPPQALERLRERTRAALAACAQDLTAAFQLGPLGLPRARDITVALAYYDKLLEEVEARQESTREQQQQQQQQQASSASAGGT